MSRDRAMSVAPFRDATGRPIVAVAAAEGGGYLRGDPLRDVLPSVPSWSEVEL